MRSRRLWDWASVHGWPVRAPGLAILLASTAFALWARLTLGVMWSSTAVLRDEHRLHTGGPYAVTRHPIYTGLLGMVLGATLVVGVGRWAVVFVIVVVIVELKLHAEERLLAEAFPADYARYRRRVPRLVPRLVDDPLPNGARPLRGAAASPRSTAGSPSRRRAPA